MDKTERLQLRRYLLSELGDQEREHLAARYFADEELFDELLDIETELFDQYARDELSPTERQKFAHYITSLPDGAYKLATAQALLSATEKAQPFAAEEKKAKEQGSWLQILRDFFSGKHFAFQYALAGALLIAFASIIYLSTTQRQLRHENEQLRAQRAKAELEKETLARQAQTSQQEQETRSERIRQLEQELAKGQSQQEQTKKAQSEDSSIKNRIVALILSPSLRSSGKPDVLRLSPETKTVSITVPISQRERILSYRAVLQLNEDGGQVVLTKDNLKPLGTGQDRRVTFSIPRKQLTGRSYKLTLQGRATDGLEISLDHYFEIGN